MARPRLQHICSIANCGKVHDSKGLCRHHYNKLWRYGDPLKEFPKPERKPCSIEGCKDSARQRGWCGKHYQRWRMHGDPLWSVPGRTSYGEAAAFYENVVLPYQGEDCLIWPYSKSKDGYATLGKRRSSIKVHRLACVAVHGEQPSPEKNEVAHSCGNGRKGCVNPKHLRWATRQENTEDRIRHGTTTRGEQHRSAKLTEEDVRNIRKLKGFLKLHELAKMFGVTLGQIHEIQKRKKWSWLE